VDSEGTEIDILGVILIVEARSLQPDDVHTVQATMIR
jgi:hypothetical protein